MNKPQIYDVFISYSRRDYVDENKVVIPNNIVSQIKDALKKANISYWFDEDGIYCGDAWAEKLAERIEECSIFLFISTSNSNKAEWTSKEIATAHMFKKRIIPFRVDESVYNKSVIIYIANLDYIDYYNNPTLAMGRLIDNISKYIKDKKDADEKLLAKKRKEENEQKRLFEEEQNVLIAEIETACVEIEEYELKAEHTRKKATAKVKKVKSADQRTRLTNLIQSSGTILDPIISSLEKKYYLQREKQYEELQRRKESLLNKYNELHRRNEELETSHSKLDEEIINLKRIHSDKIDKNNKIHFCIRIIVVMLAIVVNPIEMLSYKYGLSLIHSGILFFVFFLTCELVIYFYITRRQLQQLQKQIRAQIFELKNDK